ncbi:hypothetical protein [Methylobacterium variabile]|jgi:hypothetical protein|uniref:hypothetical protein n=1 Tax=Methylobacterium variabile TaxID=298794 RepID=UPI000ADFEA03|nr:hypothetical protein [Methylobacterium variabile]
MRWGVVVGAVLACFFGLAVPARAGTPIVLDPLLNGLLPTCYGSKSFDQFRRSVAARHGYDSTGKRVNPNAPIAVPATIAPALGSITAKNKGDYTEVIVPVSGKFRSLPVAAIEFAFGNENGINVTTIRFAESKSEVNKVLGKDIRTASRLIKQRVQAGETGADQSVTLEEKDGQTRLFCDTSN